MFAGVLALVVVVMAVLALGTGILPLSPRAEPAPTVSPEAAADAEEKIVRMTSEGEEARLSSTELTSLLRYRPEILSLAYVIEPSVDISGDTVFLSGAFASAELPSQVELEQIRFLLPDTADVTVVGTLDDGGAGTAVFRIASIEVAGMPIPPRLYPRLLERLGGDEALPSDAVALRLPDSVGSARVEDGELILTP